MADNKNRTVSEEITNHNSEDLQDIDSHSFFNRTKLVLGFMGINSKIFKSGENNTLEYLIADIPEAGETGGAILFQLIFLNDMLELTNNAAKNEILHLLANFETIMDQDKYFGVASLLGRINPLIPFGAFGIGPENNLFYRHSIVSGKREDINISYLIDSMDMASIFIPVIRNNIELYINDQLEISECLEKVHKTLSV